MPKPYRRAVCWVRRDLRLRDHAALARATARAERVAVAFVFDTTILDALEDRADRRVTLIQRALEEMDAKLRRVGSRLVVLRGDPREAVPALARALGAEAVFAARDAEPYARLRDAAVAGRLAEAGRAFETVKDAVVFEDAEMPDLPHRDFEREWRRRLAPARDLAYHRADKAALWPAAGLPEADWAHGFAPVDLPVEPGEEAARARLRTFLPKLARYRTDRHRPDREGTSGLSVDLRFGTISPRECVRAALADGSPGADKWLSELVWRDYYHAVLGHHPEAATEPFRPVANRGRESHAEAWREGRTGYPLVDAAMRCLRETGLMPNRLRMVTASFLTQGLLLDYREGERWFARWLLDFDLASNNGGWQWCAGTNADAPPYPRTLNPLVQSERFDPEGAFVRRWVPEVRELIGPALHFPPRATPLELEAAGLTLGEGYPWPVVDLVEARHRRKEWRSVPT